MMKQFALWVLLVTAACSSRDRSKSTESPPETTDPITAAHLPATVLADRGATFASAGSGPILDAALRYPATADRAPHAPPLSLTAADGTGLELISLDARAVIDGPLAFTELHLQFKNPRDRVIEGRFRITLPPEATISRLAMRLDSGWQEAEVVERQLARRAYEDFLHRRQDPALLEKQAGNEFRARIFPIPARGTKDIILSYSQKMIGADARYRLPLRGLPEIQRLSVSAQVAERAGDAVSYRPVSMTEAGYVPSEDFEVPAVASLVGMRHQDLAAMRIRPELSADTRPIQGLVVLFDTSASRALGFSRQVRQLGALIDALRALHGADTPLAVATFDQAVLPIYRGTLAGFGKPELDAALARRPLGASNLHAALAWAGTVTGMTRVVVLSDGIATAGPTDGSELVQVVRALSGSIERLDVILSGGIRDHEVATRLVRGALPTDGVVLDGDDPAEILARRISQTTASGIAVAVTGAEWVWPSQLDGVQPGDEVLVFAGMRKGSGEPAGASVEVALSGPISQTIQVPVVPVARPLIERAAMRARIARLAAARDALDPKATSERDALKREIISLSTRFRVLSDFTALLVLETEADYERYGIDRRALADVLTVGKTGVEVSRRTQPVVLADAAATKATRKATKKIEQARKQLSIQLRSDPNAAQVAVLDPDKPDLGFADPGDMGGQVDYRTMLDDDDDDLDEEELLEEPKAVAEAPPPPPPPPLVPSPGPATQVPAPDPEPDSAAPANIPDSAIAASEVTANALTARPPARPPEIPSGPPPLTGKLAELDALIKQGKVEAAVIDALAWRNEKPGDVMALIGLGQALEARGSTALAARAYGSIIDLFPSRADMRRFAGERLEVLGTAAADLAVDTYAKAVEQRPDHLTGHRLLGYARLRAGDLAGAFDAIEAGLSRGYPGGRFLGGPQILTEDLSLIGAAWVKREPAKQPEIARRLQAKGARLATEPSLRFVLYWETDANDVDFHIHDGRGGHAFYSQKNLPSGGRLYEDVTTGYGPECFTIPGKPNAYPYRLRIHYYARGPMGYGMGKLEVIRHDGAGALTFEQRPYIVMNDSAYVELGVVKSGK